jgi:hypothetical protein
MLPDNQFLVALFSPKTFSLSEYWFSARSDRRRAGVRNNWMFVAFIFFGKQKERKKKSFRLSQCRMSRFADGS